MLRELEHLLEVVDPDAGADEYAAAVIEDNALDKHTAATRRATIQRLRELYGLDPSVAIFRVLRRLWSIDAGSRPLLALLCSLARDPLLRASAPTVLGTAVGAELNRRALIDQLRNAVGDRLNEGILDKVARNAGSSWTQSGHFVGRVRKVRHQVAATPAAVAFALWLGAAEGLQDGELVRSPWARVLDRSETRLVELALEAKRIDLIHISTGAGVLAIDPNRVDPLEEA